MKQTFINFPIEALVDTEQASDIRLSPDGSYLAFVLGQTNKKNADTPSEQSIYIIETATKQRRLLTSKHSSTNHQLAWSADSQHLAFVSNRADPKQAQLYT